VWVQRFVRTNWFYTGTIVWAIVAVAIGAQEKGSSIISTIAILAALLVITYALWEAKKKEFKKIEI
jgi:hypothetical protein